MRGQANGGDQPTRGGRPESSIDNCGCSRCSPHSCRPTGSQKGINTVAELKGKRIGMEGSTVDVLVAGAALRSAGLRFKDVTVVAKSQDDLTAEFIAGRLDAIQTYPPYAVNLLKTGNYNKIFDTSKIPGEIIDTLAVDARVLKQRRDDIRRFINAYFDAYEYFKANPEDASSIMGTREGISGKEFREAISGMQIYSRDMQLPYLQADGPGGKALPPVLSLGVIDGSAPSADSGRGARDVSNRLC